MLRLMKLAAFILFGYFLFEALRGIAAPRTPSSQGQASPPRNDDSHEHFKTEAIRDSTGAARMTKVGRGVIS